MSKGYREGGYLEKIERVHTAPVVKVDGRYLSPGLEEFKEVLEAMQYKK